MKRIGERRGLLSASAAVVVLTSFLLTSMAGFLDDAATSGTRAILAATPARDAAVRVQLGSADDETTDAVQAALESRLAGTQATLLPDARTRGIPVVAPVATGARSLIVGADPGLAEHAHLVDGTWPQPGGNTGAPVPAALQATAADALGLAVGDTVVVGWPGTFVRFLITATWLPRDRGAASWFGDPAAVSGFDHESAGPLLVGGSWPQQLSSALGAPTASWTIVPSPTLVPDDLPTLARVVARLQESGVPGADSATVTGGLDQTIARVQRGLVLARAIAAIPALLVVLLAGITLARLAGLLAEARRGETSLRAARGASVASLTSFHAAEAAAVAVPAAAVGALAASLTLTAFLVAASPATLPIAGAVAAGAVGTMALVAWRRTRAALKLERGAPVGRATAAATAGAAVLVTAAAALSLRQFLLYGSPLATGPDGSAHLDPLAALAPALSLVALGLVALLCFGPAFRSVQALATRSRGLAVLPARQVARRPGVFAVALLLVTLAVGGTTLGAAFTATWSALDQGAGLIRNGSDVRVQQDTGRTAGTSNTPAAAAFAALPHAGPALPVLATPGRVASDPVSVVALRADALPMIAPALPAELRDASVAKSLAPVSDGIALTPDATRLSASVTVRPVADAGAGARVDIAGWITDADGALTRLPLGGVALGAHPADLSAPLPAGTAPWHVLALEATRADVGASDPVQVRFDAAWAGDPVSFTATATWNHPTGRVMTANAPVGPLPVILTDTLAGRLVIQPGATLSFLLPDSGASVDAVVAGTAPYLPGTTDDRAILADLRMLDDHLLRTGHVPPPAADIWIRTEEPAAVARQAALLPHVAATVSTAETASVRPLLAPVVTTLWWGVAGILLLAVVSVISTTVSLADARRGEVVLLRTLGVTAGSQLRSRVAELGVVVVSGFVLGAVAGAVVAALTVPGLARTAVGDPGGAVPVPLLVAWPAWGIALAGLALLLAAAVLGYADRIRRQVADTAWREETR